MHVARQLNTKLYSAQLRQSYLREWLAKFTLISPLLFSSFNTRAAHFYDIQKY